MQFLQNATNYVKTGDVVDGFVNRFLKTWSIVAKFVIG